MSFGYVVEHKKILNPLYFYSYLSQGLGVKHPLENNGFFRFSANIFEIMLHMKKMFYTKVL